MKLEGMTACTHLDQIRVDPPDEFAGFEDIHGRLELDWDRCLEATFEGEIDATAIWTGEPNRDAHLRSADFLDVENHPTITFRGRFTERTGEKDFKGEVELTIRGVTRT